MKNNTNKLTRSGYKHQLQQDSAQGNENQVGHWGVVRAGAMDTIASTTF